MSHDCWFSNRIVIFKSNIYSKLSKTSVTCSMHSIITYYWSNICLNKEVILQLGLVVVLFRSLEINTRITFYIHHDHSSYVNLIECQEVSYCFRFRFIKSFLSLRRERYWTSQYFSTIDITRVQRNWNSKSIQKKTQ